MKKLAHFIHPMLARIHERPFDDPGWIFETKWDGNRAIAEVGRDPIRLYSRNGLSMLETYPPITHELRSIKRPMVLDGEVVALNRKGLPEFQLLQNIAAHPEAPLVYHVFDLLELDGHDICARPLKERNELLRAALKQGPHVRYCEHVDGQGLDFFALTGRKGLEGMIAKRKDSPYRPGKRSGDWLKIKHHFAEEMVIGGFTRPQGRRKHFGALLLGRFTLGGLRYAGRVGTGFDDATLNYLAQRMAPLVRRTSPFIKGAQEQAGVTWLTPKLVCNVKFTEWTKAGEMRHPVFLGLRFDKTAQEVRE